MPQTTRRTMRQNLISTGVTINGLGVLLVAYAMTLNTWAGVALTVVAVILMTSGLRWAFHAACDRDTTIDE